MFLFYLLSPILKNSVVLSYVVVLSLWNQKLLVILLYI